MSGLNEITGITGKNLDIEVNAMGIEITDDELLSMDPQLLLELQRYLKDYRDNHRVVVEKKETVVEPSISKHDDDASLKVLSTWELSNALFEEVEDVTGKFLGTRITQDNVTYIARRWRMTDEVKTILTTSAGLGFDKFWRFNHPQESYLMGNVNYLKGCHHIGCSSHHHTPWIFVLGAESLSKKDGMQRVKEITFNTYAELYVDVAISPDGEPMAPIEGELMPGTYKVQKGGGKNITTHPQDFSKIISYVADYLPE
jgi:hypothetical protein